MPTNRGRGVARALPRAALTAPRRLARLEPGEILLLLQAPFVLPALAWWLKRRGLAAVQQRLLHGDDGGPAPAVDLARAERLAWVVQVAAAYGPWPANCLQRSVCLTWYLHRQGLASDLRIGVRQGDDRPLDFHAWVEHDGAVIGDRRDVRERYAVFPGSVAPAGATFR